ncbi:hypothetical protein [Burkholderia orbicola]|uniref:hypothetical protein n=1 Tax=Burkholderia orbicola TaxID=2978683 RepID=UPI0039A458BD
MNGSTRHRTGKAVQMSTCSGVLSCVMHLTDRVAAIVHWRSVCASATHNSPIRSSFDFQRKTAQAVRVAMGHCSPLDVHRRRIVKVSTRAQPHRVSLTAG